MNALFAAFIKERETERRKERVATILDNGPGPPPVDLEAVGALAEINWAEAEPATTVARCVGQLLAGADPVEALRHLDLTVEQTVAELEAVVEVLCLRSEEPNGRATP